MRQLRMVLLAGAATVGAVRSAAAQSPSGSVSRWLGDPGVMDYRLSISSYRLGPLRLAPFGRLAVVGEDGAGAGGASLGGVGADLFLLARSTAQPYLVGSASVGPFDFRDGLSTWSGWSAGGGFEVLRFAGLGLAVEARYQTLTRGRSSGVSIGIRLGGALGISEPEAPIAPPREPVRAFPGERDAGGREAAGVERPSLGTVARSSSAAIRTAVDAAVDAMGTPYRWGGTDRNGFDCSGLIQFAYRQAGVAMPRTSADQAAAGRSVGIDGAELAPGDVLVFSRSPGGSVSHVGLYLGEGRFIHSASKGTRISRLSPDDPDGRWWFERWLDSRRILD